MRQYENVCHYENIDQEFILLYTLKTLPRFIDWHRIALHFDIHKYIFSSSLFFYFNRRQGKDKDFI